MRKIGHESGYYMGETWISDYHYMDALQNRNKALLESRLMGEDVDDMPIIIQTRQQAIQEKVKKSQEALVNVVRYAADHVGISDIMPLQQLGRVQGYIEEAQDRFLRDLKMQFSQIAIPLERFVNSVIFRYASLINEYYEAVAIGSLIGGAVGYVFAGPIGSAVMSVFAGLYVPVVAELKEWSDEFWYGVSKDDKAAFNDLMTKYQNGEITIDEFRESAKDIISGDYPTSNPIAPGVPQGGMLPQYFYGAGSHGRPPIGRHRNIRSLEQIYAGR